MATPTSAVTTSPMFTGSLGVSTAAPGSVWINSTTGNAHLHTGNGNVVIGTNGIGSTATSNYVATNSAASKYYNNKANLRIAGKDFCLAVDNENGEEVVRLRNDGKVVWKNGVQLDEGVKAFSSLLRLGVAESAGVGASVREEIRNQVYADLIAMAKEKGSLTEEDLTFDRDSCILVEKLSKPTRE